MATEARIVKTPQGWFVTTTPGNYGPMDSKHEAVSYLSLMQQANAARSEIACTEAECL
jgi:hypothetical protein